MKVTVIKCDRCGKDITDSHYKNHIYFDVRYWHGGSMGGEEDEDCHEFDLCSDCAMEYGALTKNFIEQKTENMERIRKGTFETNSSSVHTLVMPRPKHPLLATQLVDKDGVITVSCKYYGDSGTVSGFYEKLQYLCTWIAVANGKGKYGDSEDFTATDYWDLEKCVLEPIQEVEPKVMNIKVTNVEKADFDHQMHPSNCECIVNLWDADSVITFLFNDDIYIKMSRD